MASAPMVLGAPYWDYLAAHPDQQALFDQAMRQRAPVLSLACVPLLDWPTSATIADIAGGTGTLMAAVLQAAPGARGILVDRPQVLERARAVLGRQGVADRCLLHPGDLFAPSPPADLHLLASVLPDWDDLSRLDRVGAQEGRQVAAVRLPMPSVEAGRVGVDAGGAGLVGGKQMVQQLLPVLQEGLPRVQVGADRLDHPHSLTGRVVKDGQRELVEQFRRHDPVVGHVVLPVGSHVHRPG